MVQNHGKSVRARLDRRAASVTSALLSNEQRPAVGPTDSGLAPQPASLLRLNAICPYFTMFPLDFPLGVLAEARPHEWVLDPFCGRGTTLFAARLRGLGAVGVDVNPVATALASAKLIQIRPESVIRHCRRLLTNGYEPVDIPDGEFWDRCFHPSTLVDLCRLREQLLVEPARAWAVALRGLVLGVLHGPLRRGLPSYLSNQMPRTYATKPAAAIRFWKAHELRPPEVSVLDVIRRRARFTLASLPARVPGLVHRGDATTEIARLRRSFSWIITSPPTTGCGPTCLINGSEGGSLGIHHESSTRSRGRLPSKARPPSSGSLRRPGGRLRDDAPRGLVLWSGSVRFLLSRRSQPTYWWNLSLPRVGRSVPSHPQECPVGVRARQTSLQKPASTSRRLTAVRP